MHTHTQILVAVVPWPWRRLELRSESDSELRWTVPPSLPCGAPSPPSEAEERGRIVIPKFGCFSVFANATKFLLVEPEGVAEKQKDPPARSPHPIHHNDVP